MFYCHILVPFLSSKPVCVISSSGLLLQESERFSEALHYYKLAIGSRPTLACEFSTSFSLISQFWPTEWVCYLCPVFHSCILERGHHPGLPGEYRRGQANLPHLCGHPWWEPERPSCPQELCHQLLVQPGEAASWAGPAWGADQHINWVFIEICMHNPV